MNKKFEHLNLKVLSGSFKYVLFNQENSRNAILDKLKSESEIIPQFLFFGEKELSLLISDASAITGDKEEKNWRAIKIVGEMPFGTVQGLIASISGVLRDNKIGICAISSFLTDYFFVKADAIEQTRHVLSSEGWMFVE